MERRLGFMALLKRRNGLSEEKFRQIHIGCQLKVVKTGPRREDGRYDGWRRVVPMVVLSCPAHGAQSAEFEGKPYRADLP